MFGPNIAHQATAMRHSSPEHPIDGCTRSRPGPGDAGWPAFGWDTCLPLLVLFLGLLVLVPGAGAQPGGSCSTCLATAGCEARQDNCTAECRARTFAIDPKRTTCINTCAARAADCVRSAAVTCRSRGACS